MSKQPTLRHLTYSEKRGLEKFLDGVLIKHENGACNYIEGWTDSLVADKFGGTPYTSDRVAALRKEIFGPIAGAPGTGKKREMAEMQDDIARLETRIDTMIGHIGEILKRVEDLEATLTEPKHKTFDSVVTNWQGKT